MVVFYTHINFITRVEINLYHLMISDNLEIKLVGFYPCPFDVTSVTHIFQITIKPYIYDRHFSMWHQIDMASGKSYTNGQLPGGNSLGIRAVEITLNLSECNVRHGGIAQVTTALHTQKNSCGKPLDYVGDTWCPCY